MKIPVLNDAAKLQLLGMGLGVASATWTADQLGLNVVLMLIGAVVAWVVWEAAIGMRLAATLKRGAVLVGFLSGFAFPWAGLGVSALLGAGALNRRKPAAREQLAPPRQRGSA